MAEQALTRRDAMLAGGALLVGASVAGKAVAQEADMATHDRYFTQLSAALHDARIAHPVLVIDAQRLDANIAAARQTIAPAGLGLRVVVKSLPCTPLIDRIAAGVNSNRFMVFNGSMVEIMAPRTGADLLLGKPMPAVEYANIIDHVGPEAAGRVQWLIDTPRRLQQYADISAARGMPLNANLEIDVGLHRGGFPDAAALAAAIDAARKLRHVRVTGVMGYDAHVTHAPDPELAYLASQVAYRNAIEVLRQKLAVDPATLTLNAAGSPTYARHAQGTAANEVSVGSAFVKPTDFDIPWLTHHQPAVFIATPVLKAGPFDPAHAETARGFFIYGGHWLAQPESPAGLHYSKLFGRSSNQELLTGADNIALQPDDTIFLRPTQSEAVLLQFGDILVFDGSKISASWPVFPVSA